MRYGLRKLKSTELSLLRQKDFILSQFEGKHLVVGIYLDFTSAFRNIVIDHNTLLKKLENYSVRGYLLKLIVTYINRGQFVQIQHNRSNLKLIAKAFCRVVFLDLFFVMYMG